MASYPAGAAARDRFILDRRPARPAHDPWKPQGVLVEDERDAHGAIVPTTTIFLTGRECPWRCAMCDLWMHTIGRDTPAGALPAQISAARRDILAAHGPVDRLKLYNAGSFFDPRAVPDGDLEAIAEALAGCTHVIVESHPSLVGERTVRFLEVLSRRAPGAAVEVAMGLETAHPEALERLNKRMTVDDFERAAARLTSWGVAVRAFLLVSPPCVPRDAQDEWLLRSIDVAFSAGASVVSLIPTRSGNGTLDALDPAEFVPPRLADLERSFDAGLRRVPSGGARLFADTWDLERFSDCAACLDARRDRLRAMNHAQRPLPAVSCEACGDPPVASAASPVASAFRRKIT
jgi:radical SAM enzyme (TIGR01210 family)